MGEHGLDHVRIRSRVAGVRAICDSAWETETSTSGRRTLSGCGRVALVCPGLARPARNPLDDVVSLPQRAWLDSSGSGCAVRAVANLQPRKQGSDSANVAGRFIISPRNIWAGARSGKEAAFRCVCSVVAGKRAYDQKGGKHRVGGHSLGVAGCRNAGLQMALVWNNAILLDQATKHEATKRAPPCPPAWLPCLAALAV